MQKINHLLKENYFFLNLGHLILVSIVVPKKLDKFYIFLTLLDLIKIMIVTI